ncbi:permease-like cell division protein FtsX [Nonomuraea sp. H19]|uniref:permease-like cell division protein FtsX n=1 Tax=Nonomuraea sp. H19 TaxID=3452206 RepID=UPI003F8B8795
MNSPVEDRLRQALTEAGATIDTSTLKPLRAPERGRFRVDFRLVVVATAVVFAGAATAVGLGGAGGADHMVATQPEPAQNDKAEIVIFLCAKSAPKESLCQGRNVSAEEVQAIEQKVKSLPQVEEVFSVDQAAAYEDFRVDFADNKPLLDAVKVTDLPRSFRLKLKEGADREQVQQAFRTMAGVQSVVDQASTAAELSRWAPKADISVFLCQKESVWRACGGALTSRGKTDVKVTKKGKGVTNAQREAIQELIRNRPEVQSFFFETQVEAYENFQREHKDNKALVQATKVEDLPESFRIELRPGAEADKLISALARQPGVSGVTDHLCMADMVKLAADYGLSLGQSKKCTASR